jgi:hypothetical protein
MNGQIPIMKKKFNDYIVYSIATINELLNADQLASAQKTSVTTLATVYLENTGRTFKRRALPMEVQYAPVYSMSAGDFNGDGNEDLVLVGNQSYNRIYLGKHNANHGILLTGDGRSNFSYVPQVASGLMLRGDTKKCINIKGSLIFGVNNDVIQSYSYRSGATGHSITVK